ncbi:MAG: DUF5110 domain-containing protein [Faecalibacterium sp.]|jgi:hypothetical protein|nr:DUF5110 domain-containing protein [Faecalibacterium sp.]
MIQQIKRSPQCEPANIYLRPGFRVTLLTPRLFRIEIQKDGRFCDSATQLALNRNFSPVEAETQESDYELKICTDALTITCQKKILETGSAVDALSVLLRQLPQKPTWHFGDTPENLKGTARTLDEANGAVPLENGLMARCGYSVVDDSASLILTDEFVKQRETAETDLYFFGYGTDYAACLKDFYRLSGETPMIPKFALGNWWSRYHKYTEKSYRELIENFQKEKIPLTVAVIDMDWHLTEVDPKYGTGWTGYTWNRYLFPNPPAFLDWLHQQGLHVTLNIHPADGIRAYEEMYPEMAQAMGIDPQSGKAIPCDMADPRFIAEYFRVVLHPYEKQGVDFWWIDWQQGTKTRIPHLDPLWVLNHYHYLDSMRSGKRGMIFSRYAGLGSHRYPIGFSGDSYATWASLQFQPYFTANASNAGYGWWSHDICGHMHGTRDTELMMRWIQFGVFSPIMRLHSSANPFFIKEPWKLPEQCRTIMGRFMRLRHRMIPYLYTMSFQAHADGMPLVRPMYYLHPEEEQAYACPNEFYFGDSLLVAPITTPRDAKTHLSCLAVWLPKGKWTDLFSGKVYEGGTTREMFRTLDTIPVLLKEGGIFPLTADNGGDNSLANPEKLDVYVAPGKDGAFTLYEDDGESFYADGEHAAFTAIRYTEQGASLKICPVQGDSSQIPEKRSWTIHFIGCEKPEKICATIGGQVVVCRAAGDAEKNEWTAQVQDVPTASCLCVSCGVLHTAQADVLREAFQMLENADEDYDCKERAWREICGVCGMQPAPDAPFELKADVCKEMTGRYRRHVPEAVSQLLGSGLSAATVHALIAL